jgi:hypothetical protein
MTVADDLVMVVMCGTGSVDPDRTLFGLTFVGFDDVWFGNST